MNSQPLTPLGASVNPLSFSEAYELRSLLDGRGTDKLTGRGVIGQPVAWARTLTSWPLPVRESYSIVARLAAGHIAAKDAIAEARRLRQSPKDLVDGALVTSFERLRERFIRATRERIVGARDGNAAKLAWLKFLEENGIEDPSPDIRSVFAGAGVFRLERFGELNRLTQVLPKLPGLSLMQGAGFDFPYEMSELLEDEDAAGGRYGAQLLERTGAPLSLAGCMRQHRAADPARPERWRDDPTFDVDLLERTDDPMDLIITEPVRTIEADVDAELRARANGGRADARFRDAVISRLFGQAR